MRYWGELAKSTLPYFSRTRLKTSVIEMMEIVSFVCISTSLKIAKHRKSSLCNHALILDTFTPPNICALGTEISKTALVCTTMWYGEHMSERWDAAVCRSHGKRARSSALSGVLLCIIRVDKTKHNFLFHANFVHSGRRLFSASSIGVWIEREILIFSLKHK